MLVALASRSVLAAALALGSAPAEPAVQRPTGASEVQRPSPAAPATTAASTGLGRGYDGAEEVVATATRPEPEVEAPPSPPAAPTSIPGEPVAGPVPPAGAADPDAPAGKSPTPGTRTPGLAEGPEDDTVDELAYDPRVDSPEAVRARSWVRSGIVFMAVGGVLAIGGIAMRTAEVGSECNPRQDPAGNGCTEGGRNRSAAALGIPGGLLLAGGIAMLTAGKLQQRRLRASVTADRRGATFGLQLRF
jgi:hypothetical protein